MAKLGQLIVGVVSWGTTPLVGAPPLELKSLYVARSHRGTGLASRLLRQAVGEDAAHLWVFEDNPRTHAFYRKHAFKPDGRHAVDSDTGLGEALYVRPQVGSRSSITLSTGAA